MVRLSTFLLASACGGKADGVPSSGETGHSTLEGGIGESDSSGGADTAGTPRDASAGGDSAGSPLDRNVTQVSVGGNATCALLRDGTAKCWGYNGAGELGIAPGTPWSSTPVAVKGLSHAVQISAGFRHTCAVLGDGTAQCWGWNDVGQLGNGTTTNASAPVVALGLSGVAAITAGDGQSQALLADGTVWVWGEGAQQLADGGVANGLSPVAQQGLSNVVEIAAGEGYSCAAIRDGTVQCWGFDDSGQLGDGTTTSDYRSTPEAVQGLSGAVQIALGTGDLCQPSGAVIICPSFGSYACARLGDGSVKCWGSNICGSLGDGTTTDRSTPVTVQGLSGVVQIASGWQNCALLGDGTAWCWGCGAGILPDSATPVPVPGLSNVTAISVGGDSCALLWDGAVKCWGPSGYGELGNGTTVASSVPVTVVGLP
jgi:alpha-tubulin suppressor-like RCC1 family protein